MNVLAAIHVNFVEVLSNLPVILLLLLLPQVNVNVTYAGPQRGNVVLAKQAMTRGDVLAAIPIDLCWVFEKHGAPSNNLEVRGMRKYVQCILRVLRGLGPTLKGDVFRVRGA